MPLSVAAGVLEKNASKAANPPAEAPMPTIGKSISTPALEGSTKPVRYSRTELLLISQLGRGCPKRDSLATFANVKV